MDSYRFGEVKELLGAMQLIKCIMGIEFGLPNSKFPLLSFHRVASQGNISAEESFIMWPRGYSEEVLLFPSSGERERQWYPEDGWMEGELEPVARLERVHLLEGEAHAGVVV